MQRDKGKHGLRWTSLLPYCSKVHMVRKIAVRVIFWNIIYIMPSFSFIIITIFFVKFCGLLNLWHLMRKSIFRRKAILEWCCCCVHPHSTVNSAACGSVEIEPRSKRYGIMDSLISPRYSYQFCKYEQRLYGPSVWSAKLQCVLISTGSRGSRYPVSLSRDYGRHETKCETARQTKSLYSVNEGASNVGFTFLNSLIFFLPCVQVTSQRSLISQSSTVASTT
jgi:hypothetical protein